MHPAPFTCMTHVFDPAGGRASAVPAGVAIGRRG
jgi:hypothetical protein